VEKFVSATAELRDSTVRSRRSAVCGTSDVHFGNCGGRQRLLLAAGRPRAPTLQWQVDPQSCPSSARTSVATRTAAIRYAWDRHERPLSKAWPAGMGRYAKLCIATLCGHMHNRTWVPAAGRTADGRVTRKQPLPRPAQRAPERS